MRILLNPDPADGGGATKETPAVESESKSTDQSQQQAAQQQKPPDGQQPPTKAEEKPAGVTLTPDQYARLQAAEKRAAELEAAEQARETERVKAEEARLLEEGKLREVIASKEKQLADREAKARDLEARSKNTAKERDLAIEIGKFPLLPGTSDQVRRLLRDELEAVADGDQWKTQSRDGKPVEQFVRERLTSAEFAHFAPAGRQGGSGATAKGQQPPPKVEPTDPEQRLIEQLKAAYQASHGNVPVALAGHHRFGNQDHN